jgi:RHS repeat-associated protein
LEQSHLSFTMQSKTAYASALEVQITSTQRISKTYYSAGAQLIAMRQYTSPTSSVLYYLHSDHLGSTSLTTNGSGSVIARQLYDAWGNVRFASGKMPTDSGYTGQWLDSTGLMYYRARYYASSLGRFVSADTIVPDGKNPQQFNRYAYTLNNPINFTDPSGHFSPEAIAEYCNNHVGCDLDAWKANKDWWNMLLAAQGGDTLFGEFTAVWGGERAFFLTFYGEGQDRLDGYSMRADGPSGKMLSFSLMDVFRGEGSGELVYNTWRGGSYRERMFLRWVGLVRGLQDQTRPSFWIRPGYNIIQKTTGDFARVGQQFGFSAIFDVILTVATGGYGLGVQFIAGRAGDVAGFGVGEVWLDLIDQQSGDVNVTAGPIYFNFQDVPVTDRWNLEQVYRKQFFGDADICNIYRTCP